jgi:hypothetical protein
MPETNMIFSWKRDIPESSRAEKLSAALSLIRRTYDALGLAGLTKSAGLLNFRLTRLTISINVAVGPNGFLRVGDAARRRLAKGG